MGNFDFVTLCNYPPSHTAPAHAAWKGTCVSELPKQREFCWNSISMMYSPLLLRYPSLLRSPFCPSWPFLPHQSWFLQKKGWEERSENSLGFGITHKVHPMELQYLTPRWSVLAGLPPSTSSPSGMLFWWLLPGFWPPGCPWGRSRRPGGPWGPPPSPSQRAAARSRELGFSVSSFPTQPSTPTQETRNQSLG